MKALIERDGCIGCGLCCEICPEVFRLADDNFAVAYAPVLEKDISTTHEAEQSCPVSVIRITE